MNFFKFLLYKKVLLLLSKEFELNLIYYKKVKYENII